VRRFTIPSFHACTFSKSTVTFSVVMPISSLPCDLSTKWPAWISAFDGIHPTFKQVPPNAPYQQSLLFVLIVLRESRQHNHLVPLLQRACLLQLESLLLPCFTPPSLLVVDHLIVV